MACYAGNQIFREIYSSPNVTVSFPIVTGFVTEDTIHKLKLIFTKTIDYGVGYRDESKFQHRLRSSGFDSLN